MTKIQKYQKKYHKIHKKEIQEYQKNYRKSHKEIAKQYSKEYREINKSQIQKQRKKYYKINKEILLKEVAEYIEFNKEKIKERRKKTDIIYRRTHKKEKKEYNIKFKESHEDYYKEYGKEYRPKHRKQRRIYINNRRKIDINFKLASNLRKRICKILRGISKSKSTIELLGCSIDFLKCHLELQFKDGMSWSNYGYYGWHVDHIRPCSSFDTTKTTEQKKCFHYTNLQPLWAKENLIKSDKRNGEIK